MLLKNVYKNQPELLQGAESDLGPANMYIQLRGYTYVRMRQLHLLLWGN